MSKPRSGRAQLLAPHPNLRYHFAIMPAITVRHLPEGVHAALKHQAAVHNRSVEAHVRVILAAHTAPPPQLNATLPGPKPMCAVANGFAEAALPWGGLKPATPLPDLWGALKGTVHVDPATDLTEPLDEPWEASNS
jgi:hypothetical protein